MRRFINSPGESPARGRKSSSLAKRGFGLECFPFYRAPSPETGEKAPEKFAFPQEVAPWRIALMADLSPSQL